MLFPPLIPLGDEDTNHRVQKIWAKMVLLGSYVTVLESAQLSTLYHLRCVLNVSLSRFPSDLSLHCEILNSSLWLICQDWDDYPCSNRKGCAAHPKVGVVQTFHWFPKVSYRFSSNMIIHWLLRKQNSSLNGSPNLETTAAFSNWVTAFQVPKISPIIFSRVQSTKKEKKDKERMENKGSVEHL